MKQYQQLTLPKDTAWERKKWLRYVPTWIKELFRGLRSIIRWTPILYRDRDWDYHFLYIMMLKKLELMRKELVYANRFVGVEAVNKDLTLALNLLQRIIDEHYACEYQEYQKVKFDFIPTDSTAEYLTMEQTILEDNLEKYLKKYKRASKIVRKKHKIKLREVQRLAVWVGHHNQEKCERIFWKLINYKSRYWWD